MADISLYGFGAYGIKSNFYNTVIGVGILSWDHSLDPVSINRLSRYGDCHYKDKTTTMPTYFDNGSINTGKAAFLY